MKPWIRLADAPGYTVVTLTTVFDSFGYCRIGNTLAARKPIRRISRLTTTDRTGRLMKISVKAIANHPAGSAFRARSRLEDRCPSFACAAPGGRVHMSVARRLRRNRRCRIVRDRHGRSRLPLELTHRHDTVAVLQTFQDLGTSL